MSLKRHITTSSRETTPPKDSQETASSSGESPDSKSSSDANNSSQPELGSFVSDWNKCWETVLHKFNIRRSDPISLRKCLEKIKSLDELQVHPDIQEAVEFVQKALDFDINMELWDTEYVDGRRQVKQSIKSCECRIFKDDCALGISAEKTLKLRVLDFLDELKRFLNIKMTPNAVEGAVLSFFQSFASLANLNFRPGSAIKVSDTLTPLGDGKIASIPDLRAFVPIDMENWDLMKPSVLALAEMKAKYSTATRKGPKREYDLRDREVSNIPAFAMSEKLLGQLVGELLLEYESSVFRDEGKIIGFGVQGSEVQMFILHMRDADYYGVDKRTDSSSSLTISQPYDIMLSDQRNELLFVMSKLASYKRYP